MSKADVNAKLVKVKLALADKCDRVAKVTNGAAKRQSLLYQATRFRRQAADLTRL
jgi:hypothetical protein